MVSIKINAKGLRAALRIAEKQVAERLDVALEKNANEMVGSAKALAEANKLTGALIDSISVEKKGQADYVISATDDAAAPNEWGTRKMDAQPFFYPAYRLGKKRARGRIARAIKAGIKDAGLDGKK